MNMTECISQMRSYIDNPSVGLPEEIFLFMTELTPMTNVDLLVRDAEGRVLLAWRNDKWYGKGWHVPGGILRVKETFDERIQKCAMEELHTKVSYVTNPLEMFQIIEPEFKTRCHFFSYVFDCKVPANYMVDNGKLKANETGYLAWHDHFPKDMLRCHNIYRKYFKN